MRPIMVLITIRFLPACIQILEIIPKNAIMKTYFYLPALLALCLYSNLAFGGKPVITFSGDTVGCGSTLIIAMGATTYHWSNGSDSASRTITSTGVYTVTG